MTYIQLNTMSPLLHPAYRDLLFECDKAGNHDGRVEEAEYESYLDRNHVGHDTGQLQSSWDRLRELSEKGIGEWDIVAARLLYKVPQTVVSFSSHPMVGFLLTSAISYAEDYGELKQNNILLTPENRKTGIGIRMASSIIASGLTRVAIAIPNPILAGIAAYTINTLASEGISAGISHFWSHS